MSTASSPSEYDDSFPPKDLILPDDLRRVLAEPIGAIVAASELPELLAGAPKVVTVGDVVTATLLGAGIEPNVAVFDYRTHRSEERAYAESISRMKGRLVRVENPPGRITKALWDAVRDAVGSEERSKIEVAGEEDLAALVAIVMCPEGAQVIYGIPNKGLTVVEVNGETRTFASAAIDRMIR